MDTELLPLLLAWFFAFIFSTTLHEAGHAWAALRLGDTTAYQGGQVSLNPVPHMQREPVGMIVVPLISFFLMQGQWMIGWASAPYDPAWARRHPKRSALMALAGPLANLILVIVAGLAMRVGLANGYFLPGEGSLSALIVGGGAAASGGLATVLSVFFTLNVVLFAFNLIPVPPLDGSGVIQLAMPDHIARRYQELFTNPMWSMVGLVAAWRLFDYVFWPVFRLALQIVA
jgi:Zn-dependent protease